MNRSISEICLEIGKVVKRSGASHEACNKVDDLLVEIILAKNEMYKDTIEECIDALDYCINVTECIEALKELKE